MNHNGKMTDFHNITFVLSLIYEFKGVAYFSTFSNNYDVLKETILDTYLMSCFP